MSNDIQISYLKKTVQFFNLQMAGWPFRNWDPCMFSMLNCIQIPPSCSYMFCTKLLNEDNQEKWQTGIELHNEHLTQNRAANCFAHM